MTYQNMKIAVTNPEYSVKVREKLRDEGYDFAALQWDAPVFVRAGYLYTYDSGLVMKSNANCLDYFKSHPNEEYVLVGDEFKKASEWFVQPETPTVNKFQTLDAFNHDEYLIAKQKAIADSILDKLLPIDPFAICAGGAPRDWHFGKPAADLDIFFYTHVDQLTIVAEMLRHVGIELVDEGRTGGDLPEWYKLNPALKCVFSTVVDGVNVQLMLMNETTHKSVVPHFPFSICKIWYKRGTIRRENVFDHCERNKVVVKLNTVYNDEHKYVQKIKAKFPDWNFCDTMEEAYKHAFYRGK